MTTTTRHGNTDYTTTEVKIKNTTYQIMVVKGEFNYINVTKKMHIRSLGKRFESFDEAVRNYKNPQLKVELLKVEMGLN